MNESNESNQVRLHIVYKGDKLSICRKDLLVTSSQSFLVSPPLHSGFQANNIFFLLVVQFLCCIITLSFSFCSVLFDLLFSILPFVSFQFGPSFINFPILKSFDEHSNFYYIFHGVHKKGEKGTDLIGHSC